MRINGSQARWLTGALATLSCACGWSAPLHIYTWREDTAAAPRPRRARRHPRRGGISSGFRDELEIFLGGDRSPESNVDDGYPQFTAE